MNVKRIIYALVSLGVVGCARNDGEPNTSVIQSRIDGCIASITNSCRIGEYENQLRGTENEVLSVVDVHERKRILDRLSDAVLKVELNLVGKDYDSLHNRVVHYVQCSGVVATLLRKTKDESRWLDFIVKSGMKLKQACFAISLNAREHGETELEYRRRKSAALNLYTAYEHEVILWKYYAGAGNKALLKPVTREQFVRQTKCLFDYPKRSVLCVHWVKRMPNGTVSASPDIVN